MDLLELKILEKALLDAGFRVEIRAMDGYLVLLFNNKKYVVIEAFNKVDEPS